MSNFIEINSSYRNRYDYPNPAQFEIPVNSIINCQQPNLNSQSSAYPFYNFSCAKFGIDTDPFIGIYPDPSLGVTLTWGKDNIFLAGNSLIPNLPMHVPLQPFHSNSSTCNKYFEGCQAEDVRPPVPPLIPGVPTGSSLIVAYDGLNRSCQLESPLPFWAPDHYCKIINVSKGTGDDAFIKILGGENIEEYYTNSYLEDVTLYKNIPIKDRIKLIIKYESLIRDAYLESGYPNSNWSISDSYRIRGDLPCVQGFQTNVSTQTPWPYDALPNPCNAGIGKYSSLNNGIYNCEIVNPGSNYSKKPYSTLNMDFVNLNTQGPVINVTGVNFKGEVDSIEVIFPGINSNLKPGDKLYLNGGDTKCEILVGEIGQNIDISPAVQKNAKGVVDNILKESDVYNNYGLYIPALGPEYKSYINNTNTISSSQVFICNDPPYFSQLPCKYDLIDNSKTSNNIKYTPNISGFTIITKNMYLSEDQLELCDDEFVDALKALSYNSTMFLFTKYLFKESYQIPNGTSFDTVSYSEFIFKQDWEILNNFNIDGNIDYNNSTLSSQQASCYRISLLNLTLPNVTLKSYIGGLISFYPFVYVELQNIGSSNAGAPYIINSNNPHAKNAVFKIPISDVPTPFLSKFVKLQGGVMTQIMKFNPNQNLRFRVYFGNGETYLTEDIDNCPPCFPNPLLQITCLFEIQKL